MPHEMKYFTPEEEKKMQQNAAQAAAPAQKVRWSAEGGSEPEETVPAPGKSGLQCWWF